MFVFFFKFILLLNMIYYEYYTYSIHKYIYYVDENAIDNIFIARKNVKLQNVQSVSKIYYTSTFREFLYY